MLVMTDQPAAVPWLLAIGGVKSRPATTAARKRAARS
jgi:hypothetical protein